MDTTDSIAFHGVGITAKCKTLNVKCKTSGHHEPNNNIATISVTTILNSCAVKNAYSGRCVVELKRSLNRVSSPMLVNASTNHRVCMLLSPPFTLPICSGDRKKENSSEAAINPRINFGNRSQITPNVGF